MTDTLKKYSYKNLVSLRTWITIVVVLKTVVTSATLLCYAVMYGSLREPGSDVRTIETVAPLQVLIASWTPTVDLVILIVAGILLLIWMHRAFANLIASGVKELSYTPKWAVGWWFVPVGNLFKPYSAMKELYLASNPSTGLSNWYPGPNPGMLIGMWWSCWIGGNLFTNIGSTMFWSQLTDKPESALITTPADLANHEALSGLMLLIASSILQFLAQFLLIRIVRRISSDQVSKFEKPAESASQA